MFACGHGFHEVVGSGPVVTFTSYYFSNSLYVYPEAVRTDNLTGKLIGR